MARLEGRMTHIYKEMGQAYKIFIQDNVEKEQSPDGSKWQQLSPWTAEQVVAKGKRKGQKRGYHPILRVTGRMTHLYVKADSKGVKVGTNVKYAPLQQFGGTTPKGHRVPARPWLFDANGGVPESFRGQLYLIAEREIGKCLP